MRRNKNDFGGEEYRKFINDSFRRIDKYQAETDKNLKETREIQKDIDIRLAEIDKMLTEF